MVLLASCHYVPSCLSVEQQLPHFVKRSNSSVLPVKTEERKHAVWLHANCKEDWEITERCSVLRRIKGIMQLLG